MHYSETVKKRLFWITKKAFDLWVFLFLVSPADWCGLALVDTWHSSKSTWSLDRQVTWKSRWSCFTLTHNPTKFNDHWRCELEMHLFANITRSHGRWVTWLDGCRQLNLSHTLLKLVVIVLEKVEIKLFCISRYHMINESRDSLGEIPLS